MPNTERVAKAKRKRFTAAEKLRILREVGSLSGVGRNRRLDETGRNIFLLSHDLAQTARTGRTGWVGPTEREPKPDPQAIELAKRAPECPLAGALASGRIDD